MSAITIKKPYSCGDKGPPEPLSPAAQWDEPLCSCSSVLPGCCGEDVYYSPTQNTVSSTSVAPPQHWEGLAFCLKQNWPFLPVCPGNSIEQSTLNDSVIKTYSSCHCRHWRTWAVSGRRDGSGPSCTLLLCWQTTTVYYLVPPQVFAGLNSLYLPSINAY